MTKEPWYWVAYPEGIEKVHFVGKGTGGRRTRRGTYTKPCVVVNEEGEEYIISEADLHASPREAAIKVAELQQQLGIKNNPVDDVDIEEEEDDIDEEVDKEFEEEDDEETSEDPEY